MVLVTKAKQKEKKLKNMVNEMRKEYDFSKGERGKFYHSNIKMNIPIYLDEEVSNFIDKIASKKGIDRSSLVNELLRSDIKIAEAME